ncbi:MAG: DUF6580 family putative transport protein [Sphingobacteriales bacterium]
MSLQKINPRTKILLLFMIAVDAVRILLHLQSNIGPMANFTPIGAMALFGGAHFSSNKKAYLFPLLTLWLGDILLNRLLFYHEWRLFYEGFYWTYGAFALMVLTGRLLIKKVTIKNILLSSLLVVFIHWMVTDFGVWLEGTIYPKTWAGWWTCLTVAIPYEINLIAGTLLYGSLMFISFEWIKARNPLLQTA